LERLGEVSRLRLQAAPALRDEVLFVRVRNADINGLLTRVADLMDARWETRSDGTRMLRPDPIKVRARSQEFDRAARDTLLNSLAYVRKRLAEQPERFGTDDAVRLTEKLREEAAARKRAEERRDYERLFLASSADEEKPGWRALARVLPTLSTSTLLSMPWNGRAVWAERPTRRQAAFNPTALKALDQYRQELLAFKPEAQVARVRIVAVRWEQGISHSVSLTALDANGKVVDASSMRLAGDSDRLKIPFSQRLALPPDPEGRILEVGEEAKEYAAILHYQTKTTPELLRALPKWQHRLTHPEEFEPTQWQPAEAYIVAADTLNLNVVGSVSELTGSVFGRQQQLTARQFMAEKKGYITESEGWTVVDERIQSSRLRISRAQAGRLLRNMAARGGLSVDDAAAFAAEVNEIWPFTNWVGEAMAVLGPVGGIGHLSTTGDDTLLRFWHHLGPAGRKELLAGRAVGLDRLPPTAQAELERMVFHESRLGERKEPTEQLPDGIVGGTLTLQRSESPVFIAWTDAEGLPVASRAYTPGEFGTKLAKGDPYRELPVSFFQQLNRFRLGTTRRYDFRFDFGNGVAFDTYVTEGFFPPGGKAPFKLPDPILREVEAAREKALATDG
jgi:hypothetical protein